MKRIEHRMDHNIAQEHPNNGQHEPAAQQPVKRVVFRLGATVMRQASLTQEQEGEERLVMDFSEEEVRRR